MQQRLPAKGQSIHPGGGRVDYPPPLHRPAADGKRRHDPSIDEQDVAFPPILQVDLSLRRVRVREVERSIRQEPVVGENQQLLGDGRERIVRGADDDRPEQTLRDLIARAPVGVGVVPVGARGSLANREDVVVPLARRDGIVRTAIGVGRKIESVPVNGGRLGQIVAEMDDHPVALVDLQSGAGNTAVVSKDVGGRAG